MCKNSILLTDGIHFYLMQYPLLSARPKHDVPFCKSSATVTSSRQICNYLNADLAEPTLHPRANAQISF